MEQEMALPAEFVNTEVNTRKGMQGVSRHRVSSRQDARHDLTYCYYSIFGVVRPFVAVFDKTLYETHNLEVTGSNPAPANAETDIPIRVCPSFPLEIIYNRTKKGA